ncbi:MAG: glycosyltransferase [Planctomycetaceae bacterium]|jgi:glycosyltransferase EpsF|nr:glycosyltransferase [Planctomycetaceae bacterium]
MTISISNPIRVLQVFGVLNRVGGAEKWILDLFHQHDPRLRFDFLLSLDDGNLVQEIRQLGSTVYRVPFSKSPLPCTWGNPYLSGVRNILRNGGYDAVHVHQFDLSGEILRIAAQEQVSVRVMSVHATQYENPRFYRRLVHHAFGRPWIFRYATDILPCSQAVAESFAPPHPKSPTPTPQILYTGIDPTVFEEASRRRDETGKRLRRELNLPDQAIVLGHIGRFTQQKNHRFLIELLEPLFQQDHSLYAVLVGHGEQWESIRRVVQKKQLQDRLLLTGYRSDVPDLLCSLFDVFLLPSLYEGLPIAAIEALAAGLGVVYSDRISHEPDNFFPQRVRRLALETPKKDWIRAIREMLAVRCETSSALEELATTPLTLHASLEHLIRIYCKSSGKWGVGS